MRTTNHSWSISLTTANGKTGSNQIVKGAWSGTRMGPRPTNTLVLVHRDGAEEGDSFNLGLHTRVLCTKIFTIKVCVMENTKIGYTCRNIYFFSNIQAATKAFGSFQINSKLVWESHQSLVKLAENNRSN